MNEYKQTPIGEIPKDWQVVRLGDVSVDFVSGGTPSTKNAKYWDGNIPWMTSAHIIGRTVSSGMRYITELGLQNSTSKVVPKNSILIATRVGIGKIAVNLVDMAISQDVTGVVLDRQKIDANFAYWLMASYSTKLKALAQGSTIKGLLRREVEKLKIVLPPLPQQKKIAEVLSTVDEGIGKVDQAIRKTERLKKGLMQELLAKGIGHKKFKDTAIGRIPREWETPALGEVAELIMGQSPPGSTYNEAGVGMPFLQGKAEFGAIVPKHIKCTTRPLKIAPQNSVLMSVRAPVGDVNLANLDYCIGRGLASLHLKVGNDNFLFYLLSFHKPVIEQLGTGSTFKAISKPVLNKLRFPLPPLPEQKKIAEILSTVDRRLELLRKRKHGLGRIKKGLMNDLLTGKRRVKV